MLIYWQAAHRRRGTRQRNRHPSDSHLAANETIRSVAIYGVLPPSGDPSQSIATLRNPFTIGEESSAPPSNHLGRIGSGRCMTWAVPRSYPPGPRPSPLAPFAASPKKEGSLFEFIQTPIDPGRSHTPSSSRPKWRDLSYPRNSAPITVGHGRCAVPDRLGEPWLLLALSFTVVPCNPRTRQGRCHTQNDSPGP